MKIQWTNVLVMAVLHALFVYGIFRFPALDMRTLVFTWILGQLSTVGVITGAHRLWCHQTYKANVGVRLFLMLCQTLALQNDILQWVRNHRARHRLSEIGTETNSASRGFYFFPIGWFLVSEEPPEIARKSKTIDVADLRADPIVMFQRKYYVPLVVILWVTLPIAIPYLFWNENLLNAIICPVLFRYVLVLDLIWFINSCAHAIGPIDKRQTAVEVSFYRDIFFGDGHHNYRHAYPWDCESKSEVFGAYSPSTVLISIWYRLGWAWDLKRNPISKLMKRPMKSCAAPDALAGTFSFSLAYACDSFWF